MQRHAVALRVYEHGDVAGLFRNVSFGQDDLLEGGPALVTSNVLDYPDFRQWIGQWA